MATEQHPLITQVEVEKEIDAERGKREREIRDWFLSGVGGIERATFGKGEKRERYVVFGGCKCWFAVEMCPLVVGEKLWNSQLGCCFLHLPIFFILVIFFYFFHVLLSIVLNVWSSFYK